MDQIRNIQTDTEMHMKKCIDNFKKNINGIHVGRISPNILNNIQIDYYGLLTPLTQLTNAVTENSRTLAITVFDNKIIKLIEKAIYMANLGLVPISNGNIIRITLPNLTEEHRHILMKKIRVEAEKSKVSVRNIRRIAHEKSKNLFKNKKINEDEEHCFQHEIQKLTNFWIKEIDVILTKKELELMKF